MKKTLLLLPAALLAACSDGDTPPMVNLGIDSTYNIYRMRKLDLRPALTGREYRWTLLEPDGTEQLLSTSREYIFLSAEEGTYRLRFEIIDPESPYEFDFTINVLHEEVEYSPYISRVYEYRPAPGQYVNEMPRYEEGDTYEAMLQKAEESVSGTNDTMITLGGYGGYVTFGFDHTVINQPGEKDFRIWGNCFYELTQPDRKGGSAEPGIVMVSYDANCNGIPDHPPRLFDNLPSPRSRPCPRSRRRQVAGRRTLHTMDRQPRRGRLHTEKLLPFAGLLPPLAP